MSEKFTAFDLVGVIGPGTILLLGLGLIFPTATAVFFSPDFSIGGFGIFILIAFIAGHFVQAFGSLLQAAWWFFRDGMPTSWVLQVPPKIITNVQRDDLFIKVERMLNDGRQPPNLDPSEWELVIRMIYSAISKAGRSERIDIFNMHYVLMRGLLATFLILAALLFVLSADANSKWVYLCLGLALISGIRMDIFGCKYAREIFVEYLQLASR